MRFFLGLSLVFGLFQNAAGLQKAHVQDYREIAARIDNARAIEVAIERKTELLASASKQKAVQLEKELEVLYDRRSTEYSQAMWLTIRAYDIIPFADNFPILDEGVSVIRSPEKGKKLTWIPVFDDFLGASVQDEFGNIVDFRYVDPRAAGNTASDGVTVMFPRAFDSPVELASYLIHEQFHFTQNTKSGNGDAKTTAELEVAAYEEELRLVRDDILGFPEEIKTRQLARLNEVLNGKKGEKGKKGVLGKRAKAKQERAEADRNRGGQPLPERSYVSHHEDQIADLVKQARTQIEMAQQEHDSRLRIAILELLKTRQRVPGRVG